MKKYRIDRRSGVCYIEQFSLPSYVFALNKNLNPSNLYDVIFVASGYDSRQFNAYIIDTKNKNDTYYWQLPLFNVVLDYQYFWVFVIYVILQKLIDLIDSIKFSIKFSICIIQLK